MLLLAMMWVLAGRPGFGQASAALDALLEQAQTAQSSAQYAAAASAYAKATRLAPRIAELWANRGLMEHLANQPKHAIASFHRHSC